MKIKQTTKVANVFVDRGDGYVEKFYIDQVQFYEPIKFGLFLQGSDKVYPTYDQIPIVIFEGRVVNEETQNCQFEVIDDPKRRCMNLGDSEVEKKAIKKALGILNLDKDIEDIRKEYYWKKKDFPIN
ncbi:MAG: hypothetical protein HFJ41_03280 [Clostridia bacterium]|nr:hypothetical protein [Clostridia bacterium]